jgi:hypothetical protein
MYLHIVNHDTRCRWVVNFTSFSLYPHSGKIESRLTHLKLYTILVKMVKDGSKYIDVRADKTWYSNILVGRRSNNASPEK